MDVPEKITGWQAQGEEGQAYIGNSCSNEELIKVAGRKTGRAATRHTRSGLARDSPSQNKDTNPSRRKYSIATSCSSAEILK